MSSHDNLFFFSNFFILDFQSTLFMNVDTIITSQCLFSDFVSSIKQNFFFSFLFPSNNINDERGCYKIIDHNFYVHKTHTQNGYLFKLFFFSLLFSSGRSFKGEFAIISDDFRVQCKCLKQNSTANSLRWT